MIARLAGAEIDALRDAFGRPGLSLDDAAKSFEKLRQIPRMPAPQARNPWPPLKHARGMQDARCGCRE